ncbi:MAG TPA: Maf family protein [Planctomycetota bacterium]|nr:Maf family protein [Planctomycetota bacterium]
MSAPRLILASASGARAALLRGAGLPFEVVVAPGAAEEAAVEGALASGASPEDLVLAAARAKAGAVAAETGLAGRGPLVVLAADTVVSAADGGIVGKGRDEADSAAILRRLAGSRHRVITGVVLMALPSGRRREFVSSSVVEMAAMTDAEISAYVASGAASGAAGAYRIQEDGTDRFARVAAGSFSNVVGLPVEEIIPELAAMGVRPAAGGSKAPAEERSR